MKRLIMFVVVLALTINVGPAWGAPPKAYVGLYADGGHTANSVYYTGSITTFEMWIWWVPGVHGLQAAEYKIVYPSNVTQGVAVISPEAQVWLGYCLLPAGACAFTNCQVNWVWSHRQTCHLLDNEPSVILIVDGGFNAPLDVASCEPGYPIEDVTVLSYLYLNQTGVIAVEPTSWGAIKGLYR